MTLMTLVFGVAVGFWPADRASASTSDANRPFCADRPGLATPACTMAPGEGMLEFGSLDWTSDRADGVRTEALTMADVRIRLGIATATELQLDIPAHRAIRLHEQASGARQRATGVGNLTLALRHNFANPAGDGISWALMPWVSLPTGSHAVNDAVYAVGLSLPVTAELADGLSFAWTPEMDWVPDETGNGHHAVVGTVLGLGGSLGEALSFAVEASALHDSRAPAGSTQYLGGLSAGWQVATDVQIDAGINLGLNRAAPDTEFYTGVAFRF